jgi:hypothetical protein
VVISDLAVGIDDLAVVPVDFIKFGDINAHVQTINTRFDVWTIPFVDIYGIVGKTWASTNVNSAGLFWVPVLLWAEPIIAYLPYWIIIIPGQVLTRYRVQYIRR